MARVVNNKEKKGYDDGYEDGLRGKNFRYHSGSWNDWSDYAIKTYKNGYKHGYKSGQKTKKQNDNRSRQKQKRQPQNNGNSYGDSGCMATILIIASSLLGLSFFIFSLM